MLIHMGKRRRKPKEKVILSETATLLEFLKAILVLPIKVIGIIAGKGTSKDLAGPIDIISDFLTSAKFTVSMILLNITVFIASGFFPTKWLRALAISPVNMLEGRLYTLITAGFLHADLAHLTGNMIFLFIFGRVVERKLGSSKTALIYFGAMVISGFFSNIIYLLMGKDVLGIGASGALMGLVSAGMLLDPFYITYVLFFPLPVMLIGWMALYSDIMGILTPLETNIGHLAHLGGFLSISGLMYLFEDRERAELKKGLIINLFSLVCAIILLRIFRTFIR